MSIGGGVIGGAAGVPRRIDVQRLVHEERLIRDARLAVDCMPPDPRLTDAVVLLSQAQDKVADYVDETLLKQPPADAASPRIESLRPEPNRQGHVYLPRALGGLRTAEGYARCSLCGCPENSGEAARACLGPRP